MDEQKKLPLNRYARKKQHKWELKKRHTKGIYTRITTPQFDEMKMRMDYEEDAGYKCGDGRNGGYTYWTTYYISGSRKFAKQETNRRIRAKYRKMLANLDMEDIHVLSGADYEKEFDYMWTVY